MKRDLAERIVARRGGADAQRRRHVGTRLGIESRVAPGWAEYREGNAIERHTREVHYDVLRREGIDADRAREIAAESSERQARELERIRGEGGSPRATLAPAARTSGWDIRRILPDSLLTDEERAARAAEIVERDARLLGGR